MSFDQLVPAHLLSDWSEGVDFFILPADINQLFMQPLGKPEPASVQPAERLGAAVSLYPSAQGLLSEW